MSPHLLALTPSETLRLGTLLAAILTLATICFALATHRWSLRITALAALCPLFTQLWMLACLVPFVGTCLVFGAAFAACIIGITGLLSLLTTWARSPRIFPLPTIQTCIALTALVAVPAAMIWVAQQEESNKRNGVVVADAILRYRADTGSYPADLAAVSGKYLLTLPPWHQGFVPVPFIYGLDYDGKPYLKYIPGLDTGVFYSFERRCWETSAL